MEFIKIIGDNHFEKWTKQRAACRGIVVSEGKVLLSYEEKADEYFIPGGGLEEQESMEECCRREISEETGVLVSVDERYLTMNEFYEEWFYETHFFICNVIGETERKLTEREQSVALVPRWVEIDEAISIFSKYQDYADTDEEKRGIYLREYTALKEFVKQKAVKQIYKISFS